jgi:ribosomal protein S18 acetylase RimI-like enzyme
MTIEIVPIAEEHIEGFHRTLDSVARERLYLAALSAPPIDATRRYVETNIANDHPQFVALSDGKVVGWCDVTPDGRPIQAHCGTLGMGLLPDYRGRGIGKSLLNVTLAKACEHGFKRVQLQVHESNVRAIALYRRAGFETEGLMRKAVCVDGRYDNLVCMAMFFENH